MIQDSLSRAFYLNFQEHLKVNIYKEHLLNFLKNIISKEFTVGRSGVKIVS